MNYTDLDVNGDTITARIGHDLGDGALFYSLTDADADLGTVLVKPSRFGMHPDHGVMVTLGGYSGHLDTGDWSLRGSVICSGPGMTPGPVAPTRLHPNPHYPISDVRNSDPATAAWLTALVTAIATHYRDNYRGTGVR